MELSKELAYSYAAVVHLFLEHAKRQMIHHLSLVPSSPAPSQSESPSQSQSSGWLGFSAFGRGNNSKRSNSTQLMAAHLADYSKWAYDLLHVRLFPRLGLSAAEQDMISRIPLNADSSDSPFQPVIQPFVDDLVSSSSSLSAAMIVKDLYLVAVSGGVYDARSRVLLFQVGSVLATASSGGSLVRDLVVAEREAIQSLLEAAVVSDSAPVSDSPATAGDSSIDEHMDKRISKDQGRRIGIISAAAVGGGLIIGLTGGLAAPLVGAGLASLFGAVGVGGTAAFFGSVGGAVLITSLFGVTGAGMASYRMSYRSRGISEFLFVAHSQLRSMDELVLMQQSGRSFWSRLGFGGGGASGGRLVSPATSEVSVAEYDMEADLGLDSPPAGPAGDDGEPKISYTDTAEFFCAPSTAPPPVSNAPTVTITISGWITSLLHVVEPWMSIDTASEDVAGTEHFSLCWETKELLSLARVVEDTLATEAVSAVASQALGKTIMAGLMSAMLWPAAILKVGSVLDNPWSVSLERARKTGLLLADVLRSYRQGHRPVTLIGSSLGARVILFCLLELAERGNDESMSGNGSDDSISAISGDKSSVYSIVENVYLIGAPIAPTDVEWRRARSVVSGRFVNAYCTKDWVLGFMMRASGNISGIAGLGPVLNNGVASPVLVEKDTISPPSEETINQKLKLDQEPQKSMQKPITMFSIGDETTGINDMLIENIDVSEIAGGHMGYRDPEKIKKVLDVINGRQTASSS